MLKVGDKVRINKEIWNQYFINFDLGVFNKVLIIQKIKTPMFHNIENGHISEAVLFEDEQIGCLPLDCLELAYDIIFKEKLDRVINE